MSLSHRQCKQLRRIDAGLCWSEPELRAKFDLFGRLYRDQDMPASERAPQTSQAAPAHGGLRRAAAWIGLGPLGPLGPRPARPGRAGRLGRLGRLGWEADVDPTDGW